MLAVDCRWESVAVAGIHPTILTKSAIKLSVPLANLAIFSGMPWQGKCSRIFQV
jgi:hypothetical protein